LAWWMHLVIFGVVLLVQVSVVPGIGPAGVRPDLVLAWAISASILEEKEKIALGLAACGGAMVDITVGRFLGLNAALFLAAAIGVRRTLRAFMRPSLFLTVAVTVAVTVVVEMVRGLLWHSGVAPTAGLHEMLSVALTVGGLSGGAAVLFYFIILRSVGVSSWEKS